ncbi:MAG TPA: hypothetical protein VIC05_06915 [Solirubrobacteraceae bacterium]|jgi:UDP-N-acetyl-D-mannosaminuronate dehydrogenase
MNDQDQNTDIAVIATAHPKVDYDKVLTNAPLIVDLRGTTRRTQVENIIRL